MFETYNFVPNHVTRAPVVTMVTADHVTACTELRELLEGHLRQLLDICQENVEGSGAITVLEVGGVSIMKR